MLYFFGVTTTFKNTAGSISSFRTRVHLVCWRHGGGGPIPKDAEHTVGAKRGELWELALTRARLGTLGSAGETTHCAAPRTGRLGAEIEGFSCGSVLPDATLVARTTVAARTTNASGSFGDRRVVLHGDGTGVSDA